MSRTLPLLVLIQVFLILILSGCSNANEESAEYKSTVIPSKASSTVDNAANLDCIWPKNELFYFEPDIVHPISHIMVENIESIGSCEFVLHGFYGVESSSDPDAYLLPHTMINAIEIRAINGSFHQRIDGLSTFLPISMDNYGFSFDDWNADGSLDLSLLLFEGGSMRNQPALFWLWDSEQERFVENEQLTELSDYATLFLDPETDSHVITSARAGLEKHIQEYYEYQDGRFCLMERERFFDQKKDDISYRVTQISKLVDGEMIVVEEKRVPFEE